MKMHIESRGIEEDEKDFDQELFSLIVNKKLAVPDILIDVHQKVMFDTIRAQYEHANEKQKHDLLENLEKTSYEDMKKLYFEEREERLKEKIFPPREEREGETKIAA